MDILALVAVVVFVAIQTRSMSTRCGISNSNLAKLLGIHSVATLFYMGSLEGDWAAYLEKGLRNSRLNASFEYFAPGTRFIDAICHFLQLSGQASTPAVFFVFSLLGFLGHVFFIAACRPFLRFEEDKYWPWIFLLPGLHIWTCAIGKDSLIFLPLCYTLYAASRNNVNDPWLYVSGLLIFMIRPHIALCVTIAWVLASLLANTPNFRKYKAATVTVGLVAFGVALPRVTEFLRVGEFTVEGTLQRLDHMATYNQQGGGAVALEALSPPLRLLTFMFRPLFFDIQNLMGWPASLENLLLVGLFLYFLRKGILQWILKKPRFDVIFATAFAAGVWFLLGMSIANLGLALRQKTMILPFVFYVFFAFRHANLRPQRRRIRGVDVQPSSPSARPVRRDAGPPRPAFPDPSMWQGQT